MTVYPPRFPGSAWAGEIGQMQFLSSTYLKFAVDFEGYGRRDLIHSALNALASTANYLKSYGWTAQAMDRRRRQFRCSGEVE
jgi:membrane-bound lytic murein transglycosylase B